MITRAGGSVALVLAEAAWCSLLLDAVANGTAGTSRPAVALPFGAVALAAVVAVALAAVVRRRVWALVAAVAGAALTAELVAGLTPGVAMWAAPTSAVAVRATTWAAVVAVLAWARGFWLGRVPPSEAQAATSVVIGWLVTLSILIQRSDTHDAAFTRATSDAGWLLLVLFLAGLTAVGWAHLRSLERALARPSGTGPGGAWLVVTGVPLVVVAAVAFLLGGAATSVVPALTGVIRDLGGAFFAAGTWFFSHLLNFSPPHVTPHSVTPAGGIPYGLGRAPTHRSVLLEVLAAVPEVIAGLAVLLLLGWFVRFLVHRLRRRVRPERAREERTSLFSWRHLLAQLRAMLSRRSPAPVVSDAGALAPEADRTVEALDPVRAAYRRFLVAAHEATVGREDTETPRELAGRLELDRDALGSLTGAYERTRYGQLDAGAPAALEAAEALALELSRPRRGEASPDPT